MKETSVLFISVSTICVNEAEWRPDIVLWLCCINSMSPIGSAYYLFHAWLVLQPRRWRGHTSLKCLLTFGRLHSVVSQQIELLTVCDMFILS
jgi:hypothetical protein